MQVLVAVKWVPAPESVAFDPVLNRINRTGVAGMLNPLDWGAIDTALTLRRERGGRVTAVTMGPPEAGAGLWVALAAGVDAGIHLCDPAFAGADTLATSRVLAEVFRTTSADLFLFGANTIDGGTAQTAAQVAAITGAAVLTEAWEVTPTAGGVAVMRHCDGNVERWSVPFPAVVSVARRPAPPETEPADIAGRIEQWDAERLGLDIRLVGIRGSATYVQKITPVAVYRAGRAADPVTAAQQVATLLRPALPSSNAPTRARVCTPTGCSLWALVEVVGDRVHRSSLEGLGEPPRVPRTRRSADSPMPARRAGPSGPGEYATAGRPERSHQARSAGHAWLRRNASNEALCGRSGSSRSGRTPAA